MTTIDPGKIVRDGNMAGRGFFGSDMRRTLESVFEKRMTD
jgi:hypothetical protein